MSQFLRRVGRLIAHIVSSIRKHRLVGVAAEVAFFALLSIPPMLLILAGVAGYVGGSIEPEGGRLLQERIVEGMARFIAPEAVDELVGPAVESLFERGRGGIVSVGILITLLSASRIVRVLIEAMNIAYGIEEWRRPWKRRLMAVAMTAGGVVTLGVFLPVILAGPEFGEVLASRIGRDGLLSATWWALYWPLSVGLGIALLTSFYNVAPNWKSPWRRDLPGAILAAGTWLGAAFALRVYVQTAIRGDVFGPLAAPIVLMLWLYVSAFAVLLGAELNAAIAKIWPLPEERPKET